MSMIKMEVSLGTMINEAARRAIALVAEKNSNVQFEFNGVKVTVSAGQAEGDVVQAWRRGMDEEAERYRNSPEGKKAAQEAVQRAEEARVGTAKLVAELERISAAGGFKTLEDGVRWLAKYSDHADHVDSESGKYKEQVLGAFWRMGHTPGQGANETGLSSDAWRAQVGRDGVLKWLIGQGLDGIASIGAPHPLVRHFAEKEGIKI